MVYERVEKKEYTYYYMLLMLRNGQAELYHYMQADYIS